MRINNEKQRRTQLCRAIGNRVVPRPPSGAHVSAPYRVAHACFACRSSFKIPVRQDDSAACPTCGQPLYCMGRSFKAPARRQVARWRTVQALYAAGFRFWSYRSFPDAPPLPQRFQEVAPFVARYPNHPMRMAPPNAALQQAVVRTQQRHYET